MATSSAPLEKLVHDRFRLGDALAGWEEQSKGFLRLGSRRNIYKFVKECTLDKRLVEEVSKLLGVLQKMSRAF